MPTLEVEKLSRDYRSGRDVVHALVDVDLTADEGEIVGLLGLNGAGKTTMLKVVSTLLLPTAGAVRVAGFDVVSQTNDARRILSVVLGGERGFYNRLSALDNIHFFATLSGVPRRTVKAKSSEALEQVGLGGAASRPVETFSKGMKQRLHLAIGLMTTPKLLLLDEPTVGLDPIEAERLRGVIAGLRGTGVAIVLTSHYLGDIERLASRVAILQRGRLTHDLPLEQLLERAGAAAEVAIRGTGPVPTVNEATEAATRAGVRLLDAARLDGAADAWTLTFEVKDWSADSLRALAALWPSRDVTDVRVQPVNLEQVFAELSRADGESS